jgi:hypothetical protein
LIERCAALQEQRALLELAWPGLLEQVPDPAETHLQAALRLGSSPLPIATPPFEELTQRLRTGLAPRPDPGHGRCRPRQPLRPDR